MFRPDIQGSAVERVLSAETLNKQLQVPDLLIDVVQLLLRGQSCVGLAVGGAISPGGHVRAQVIVDPSGTPRSVPALPHTRGHEITFPHKRKGTRLARLAASDGDTGCVIR